MRADADPASPWARRLGHGGAAAAYLALSLWTVRAVLPAPATLAPFPHSTGAPGWEKVILADLQMVIWQVSRNARGFLERPLSLFDGGQCQPFPDSITLGEHMLGAGLLGAVPEALAREPILTFNAVVALSLWLAAFGMYALVLYWTGNPAAAFVAGLLFGFQASRVGDLIHPFVAGNYWTPPALLFAHRLFARRTWVEAAGLAAFLSLQMLESFYMVLCLALMGGPYGLYLLWRYRQQLPALMPKLAFCAAVAVAVAFAVLGPYLETRAAWGVLQGRAPILLDPREYGIGGRAFPGSALLLLAAVGVIDRLRRRRAERGYDPRSIYLFAGALALWASLRSVRLPLVDVEVPSLLQLAAAWLPGLDAVRAGATLSAGVYLVLAFVAGYGVLALIEKRAPAVGFAMALAFAAAAVVETQVPAAATISFGRRLESGAIPLRPAAGVVQLFEAVAPGAVLELPTRFDSLDAHLVEQPHYLLEAAYHRHSSSACYNSFTSPLLYPLWDLAFRLPRRPWIAEELHALGFDSVVLHGERLSFAAAGEMLGGLRELTRSRPGQARLAEVGVAGAHALFVIDSQAPVEENEELLAEGAGAPLPTETVAPGAPYSLRFRNGGRATFRNSMPVHAVPLKIRWTRDGGAVVRQDIVQATLPLALARGATSFQRLDVAAPSDLGEYEVVAVSGARPDLVIARGRVRVGP